jgi:hypothetical protein
MDNLDALLAILHSGNLLLSVSGCLATLQRSFNGIFFNYRNLTEFSSSLCLPTHRLNALLAECQESSDDSDFLRTHSRFILLCTPCTSSMPTWQSFTELTTELLSSSEITTMFFSCALLALAQCPLGRALQKSSELLSATMSRLHSLAS